MKKYMGLLLATALFAWIACNQKSKEEGHAGHGKEVPQNQEDSLMADVMDGHDAGMNKYGKLQNMEKKVRAALDSISGLPVKAQQELAPYKARLDSAGTRLREALAAMDKWMQEFNMDSAKDNTEARIRYLLDEKMKVGTVKEAILSSLQMADSLFQ